MEFISGLFHNKDKGSEVHVFTLKDIDRMKKKGKDLMQLQNNIVSVNFSETDHFTDPNEAMFCLEIMASDGHTGALAHLQLNADVESIGDQLLKLYPQKKASVCLAGGERDLTDSLVAETVKALSAKGFSVSTDPKHSDILRPGNIGKRSTLYKDKVVVRNSPYLGQQFSTTLLFPPSK